MEHKSRWVNRSLMTAALAVGLALPVSADTQETINFLDFPATPLGGVDELSFSFGAATLKVLADTFVPTSGTTLTLNNDASADVTLSPGLTPNTGGLGVFNGFEGFFLPDLPEVDGFVFNDILLFEFDTPVLLDEVDFNNVEANDQFVFFAVDSAADLAGTISGVFLDIDNTPNPFNFDGTYTFTPGVEGKIFGIGAVQNNDNFRIDGLTATVISTPAVLSLLLSGFAGLAVFSSRRRRA